MPQKTRGFVQREMPLQDDGEIVGEQPARIFHFSASGSFLEENPTDDSTERPICFFCGSSSCVCEE